MKKAFSLFLTFSLLFSLVIGIIPISADETIEPVEYVDIATVEAFQEYLATGTAVSGNYRITVSELDFDGETIAAIPSLNGELIVASEIGQCTLKNLTIDCTSSGTGAGLIGGLTGTVKGIVIDKTVSYTNIEAGQHFGAIVGYNPGSALIENCVNNADITANTQWSVAGILGTAFYDGDGNRIVNCQNNGELKNTGSGVAGGIVAYANKANAQVVVENCTNNGAVTATGYAGGIMASSGKAMTAATFIKCVNTGAIYGNSAGGILGHSGQTVTALTVDSCLNFGVVKNGGGNQAGGIIGYTKGFGNGSICVTNNINYGDITTNSGQAAGIVARINTNGSNVIQITGNVNYGTIASESDGSYLHAILAAVTSNQDLYVEPAVKHNYGFGNEGVTWNPGYGVDALDETTSTEQVLKTLNAGYDGYFDSGLYNLMDDKISLVWYAEKDYVKIESADDFKQYLATGTAVSGKYCITVSELDFDGETLAAIPSLNGELIVASAIGQCTLKNLTIDCTNSGTGAGLIGGLTGTVKGIVIDKTVSYTNVGAGQHFGAIAGYNPGSAWIENCVNNANVTASTKWSVAGILGTAFYAGDGNRIVNCQNNGELNNTYSATKYAEGVTGGIVGYCNKAGAIVRIENCTNKGAVTGAGATGGILGFLNLSTSNNFDIYVEDCLNTANVISSNYEAGGIIGAAAYGNFKMSKISILRCASTGNVTGADEAAGLLGQFGKPEFELVIDSCIVMGTITSTKTNSNAKGACGLFGEFNVYGGSLTTAAWTIKNTYLNVTLSSADANAYVLAYNNNQDMQYATIENVFYKVTLAGNATKLLASNNIEISAVGALTSYTTIEELEDALRDANLLGTPESVFRRVSGDENNGYPVLLSLSACDHTEAKTDCGKEYCALCGYVLQFYPDGEHEWGEATKASDATVISNEKQSKVCTVCGQSELFEIPETALGYLEAVNGVYTVTTANQLLWIAANGIKGDIVLGNDITLSESDYAGLEYVWMGLGTDGAPFDGNFDGNGKTLTLNVPDGLFRNYGSGTIKDLVINANIDRKILNGDTGAVAGVVSGTAVIQNVTVNGSIKANTVGGIVGSVSGTGLVQVKNCTNNAGIFAYSQANSSGSAGIVGYMNSQNAGNVISDCMNTGYVTANGSAVGGIVARLSGNGSVTITACANTGDISCFGAKENGGNQAGGIAGYVNYVTAIENCINSGFVLGTTFGTGGIVARANTSSNSLKIVNCVNLGDVDGASYASGIIGYLSDATNYDFTVNTGNYSVSYLDGYSTREAYERAAGTLVKPSTKASIRVDTLDRLRLEIIFDADLAQTAGITFGNVRVGYLNNGEFVADGVVTEETRETVDGKTTVVVLVTGLTDRYYTNQLIIRMDASCNNITGYYQVSTSFSAIAQKIAEASYQDVEGQPLPNSLKAVIDNLKSMIKTVAFIGDSITDGARSTMGNTSAIHDSTEDLYQFTTNYPGYLQRILGNAYNVVNCGNSGKTMCSTMEKDYRKTDEYTKAKNAKADIYCIMLGTNDADKNNANGKVGDEFIAAWKDQYIADTKQLIDTMLEQNPDAEIWIFNCPAFYRDSSRADWQMNLTIVRQWQQEIVDTLSQEGYNIHFFDMCAATTWDMDPDNLETCEVYQYYNSDLLHPSDRGYYSMAWSIYNALFYNGKDA